VQATASVHSDEANVLHTYQAGAAVHVVATTLPGTRAAMKAATALAKGLDSRIHVIAARQLPSDRPPEQQSAELRAFAQEIRGLPEAMSPHVKVLPCVCRRLSDIVQILAPRAVVVIGGRSHRWWSSREQRFAHALTEAGYHVLFVHADDEQPDVVP
jgi:hypothetical protein